MRLKIGETIKYLRKERDVTQEELADILGVSYQSVSRWECATCYPDMELLPTIAGFFGVTVDRLLGVDDLVEEKQVARYLERFQAAISQGRIYDCIAIAREGVAEYPNNFTLLNKLMYALFVAGDSDGDIPEWQENMVRNDAEITALGERLMKYCPDQSIRLDATSRLAFNHCEMGRREIGRAIYETLPSAEFCKENQMWWGLSDEEKPAFLTNKVKRDYETFRSSVWMLAKLRCLSEARSAELLEKVFEIERIAYGGSETPDGWGAAKLHTDLARLYTALGDTERAFEHLRIGAEAAKAFDARPECAEFSSVLFGEVISRRSDFETSDSRPAAVIMRDKWLASPDFDALRGAEAFRDVVARLG